MPTDVTLRGKSFLFWLISSIVLVIAIGYYLLTSMSLGAGGAQLTRLLDGDVQQHEMRAGLKCQAIRSGIQEFLQRSVKPMLDAHEKREDWKQNQELRDRRVTELNDLLNACVARQKYFQSIGRNISNPIDQEFYLSFAVIHAYLTIGLTQVNCGQACVDTKMYLIKKIMSRY